MSNLPKHCVLSSRGVNPSRIYLIIFHPMLPFPLHVVLFSVYLLDESITYISTEMVNTEDPHKQDKQR